MYVFGSDTRVLRRRCYDRCIGRVTEEREMITLRNIASPAETSAVSGLSQLSLTIAEGEIVSVVGATAVARKRLLGILGLYTDDWSGEYDLFGHPVTKLDRAERVRLRGEIVGATVRCAPLVDCLTVEENLEIPLSYRGVPAWNRGRLIDEALERLGVGAIRDREVDTLPADQLQLVGIAKALVSNPRLVLLEEPLLNLSPLQARLVRREIERRAESGCVVVECRDRAGQGLGTIRCVDLESDGGSRRGSGDSSRMSGRLDGIAGLR